MIRYVPPGSFSSDHFLWPTLKEEIREDNEIKKTAQANSEIIKRNMETANDSLFDGELDFLDVFSAKPIADSQKKMSSLDILNEFL